MFAGDHCLFEDINVGDDVIIVYAQDGVKAVLVQELKDSYVATVCDQHSYDI